MTGMPFAGREVARRGGVLFIAAEGAFEIPVRLRQMLGDVRAQIEHQAYSPVEIAARYHHRLVAIHVFPNGNGRHARLMADLLLTELAGQRFEWGRGSLVRIPVDRDRAFRFNVTEDSEFA